MDQFGRQSEISWRKAKFHYTYDRVGTSTSRSDVVAASNGSDLDEIYDRDDLNRLDNYQLGELNGAKDAIIGTPKAEQDWSLSQLGNWANFVEKMGGTTTLDQQRTHMDANEIASIAATTGANWADPVHDATGNMISIPQPDDLTSAYDATYDAWNRLVKVEDGSDTVAEYRYDARHRRIVKLTYDAGVVDETRHFYYNANWQVLEERLEGQNRANVQYVWGLRYVDELILRDRDADGDGETGDRGRLESGLEERLYAVHDANFNVVALVDLGGNVVQRFRYTPYGERIAMDPDFTAYTGPDYKFEHGFQGLRHDLETGFIDNRTRPWLPHMGRYATRDWLGYPDGMNAYAGYHVMWGGVDPLGMHVGLYTGPWLTEFYARQKDDRYNNAREEIHKWMAENIHEDHFDLCKCSCDAIFGGLSALYVEMLRNRAGGVRVFVGGFRDDASAKQYLEEGTGGNASLGPAQMKVQAHLYWVIDQGLLEPYFDRRRVEIDHEDRRYRQEVLNLLFDLPHVAACASMQAFIDQWEAARTEDDKVAEVAHRPDILATLYNIGPQHSKPKANPRSGGSRLNLFGRNKLFGDHAKDFAESKFAGDLMENIGCEKKGNNWTKKEK